VQRAIKRRAAARVKFAVPYTVYRPRPVVRVCARVCVRALVKTARRRVPEVAETRNIEEEREKTELIRVREDGEKETEFDKPNNSRSGPTMTSDTSRRRPPRPPPSFVPLPPPASER